MHIWSPRRITAALALPLAACSALAAPAAAAEAPAAGPAPQARTVQYDASGSAEFQLAVDAAVGVWNSSVRNVRLVKGGQPTVRVLADDGWPRAEPGEPGEGTVWMGREAVRQGYDVTRIAAHELGHTLSLPDRRTGQCSDLMSGHSAPVDCKNARPSPAEAAEVEQAFQGQSR